MYAVSPERTSVPIEPRLFSSLFKNFSYTNPASDLIVDENIIMSAHRTIEIVGRSVTVAENVKLRAEEITILCTNPTKTLKCLGSFVCDKLTTNAPEMTTVHWDYLTTAFNYRTLSPQETSTYAKGRTFEHYFPAPGTVVEWDLD